MEELDYQYLSSLVERTKAGDGDAFAELYAATFQKQYRFAYQYMKDEFLAQDVLQEVYILVLKNIQKLRDSRVFISWLNQITFRVCFNMAQKNSRYAYESILDADTPVGHADSVSPAHISTTPEENYEQKEEREQLMRYIMSLPSAESQALIMRFYRDMKITDIAIAMDCSESTVKRCLASGKKKLKKLLDNK